MLLSAFLSSGLKSLASSVSTLRRQVLGRLAPDLKTIADFRHANAASIRNVCRRSVCLCREPKLFSDAIAILR